jgi:hypothetical protein
VNKFLERELKFRIAEEEDSGEIRGALERAGFRLEPSGAITHEDRYLDTEDWLLHRAGIQLRLRRKGDTVTLQAKTLAAPDAVTLSRVEWEQPAPEEGPPWTRLPSGPVAGLLGPLASLHVVNRLRVRARVAAEREVFRWTRRNELLGSVSLDRLPHYRELAEVHLVDYKVRIVDEHLGTAAKPRVLIESARGDERWSTVGCSENIIEASWQALWDSLELPLLRRNEKLRIEN